jgi:hypothetical protein
MFSYEMLIAIGIAAVLVVAAIGRLAARVMMGPEEMALLRLARAAPAQRQLVASAAQQEREARAAAAQRRLVAYWTRYLKLQYEDALAAPLPARLATLMAPQVLPRTPFELYAWTVRPQRAEGSATRTRYL